MSATISRRSSSDGVGTGAPRTRDLVGPILPDAPGERRLHVGDRRLRLRQYLPAVYHQGLARDVGRFVGREEQGGVADVRRAAELSGGHGGSHLLHVFLAPFDQALGDTV